MAKLSARGRTELVRLSKEYTAEQIADRLLKTEPLTDWERVTVALMSDGKILSKRDVRFKSDGRKHSYGWTVKAKVKADVTPERFRAAYERAGYRAEV